MEILAEHGTEEQRAQWLDPLLEGEIRSLLLDDRARGRPALIRPRCARAPSSTTASGSSTATSGSRRAPSGAAVAIVMCVTDPDAHPYARASMILVPTDNPGFDLVRPGLGDGPRRRPGPLRDPLRGLPGPRASLLGPRQAGFVIAQDRLGPGRIHHCMRAIGTAERAIEMMCRRANSREAFGGKLADKQFVQDFIAKSRMEVEQARLLTLYGGLEDGHPGQARGAARDLDDQGRRRERRHGRARPRDPGPRRPRHVRRHARSPGCGASRAC